MTAAMKKKNTSRDVETREGVSPTTMQPSKEKLIKIKMSHFWLLQLMKGNWKTFMAGVI